VTGQNQKKILNFLNGLFHTKLQGVTIKQQRQTTDMGEKRCPNEE
jgi:hypothetical protein